LTGWMFALTHGRREAPVESAMYRF